MKLSPRLFFLALAFLALPCAAQSVAEQQDARVIENLRAAGSDISKPHDIDFFFYFPRRSLAKAAATDLTALGYLVVAIERIPGHSQWQVQAGRSLVPQLETMTASTRALEDLAARHGGHYDGWGTGVVE